MADDNPILAAEQGADPNTKLPKLETPKAPPPSAEPKPFPGADQTAAVSQYLDQNKPGTLGQPLNQDSLKQLQDKLQPPELQQIQSTDLSQYTGFKPDFPQEPQTPQGDLTQVPPLGQSTQMENQSAQQLQQLQQQKLQGVTNFTQEAKKNLDSSVLKGSSSVPLFDGSSWQAQQDKIDRAFRIMDTSAEQAKRAAANGMFTDPHQYPQTETNPNRFRPDSMGNPFRNGDIGGFVHSLFNQVYSLSKAPEENLRKIVDQNYSDNDEWAPLRGWRMFADAVYKDPWKLVYAPLAPLIAASEGHYGEAGNGALGTLQYVAGLANNVVLGGLTDLHNLVTGHQPPPQQSPNFVQAFKGGSYDLLKHPDTKHPLSVFAGGSAPDNLADLKKRSILYSNPVTGWAIDRLGDLGVKKFPKPFGQNAADVGLKVGEGVVGFLGDVATDPSGHLIKWLNPKNWIAGYRAIKGVSEAEGVSKVAGEGVRALESTPERLALPPAKTIITPPPLHQLPLSPDFILEQYNAARKGESEAQRAAKLGANVATPKLPSLSSQAPDELAREAGGVVPKSSVRLSPTTDQEMQALPHLPFFTSTDMVQDIPKYEPGRLVNPADTVSVYRTPAQRTALGQVLGHVQPGRWQPLPEVRFSVLRGENEGFDRLYHPYGPPIPENELRAVIPEHPAVADVPKPETLREIVPELRKAEISLKNDSLPHEVRVQAAHTADMLADKLATPPNVHNPLVMQELQPNLPQKYWVSSDSGLNLLQQKLEQETNYHAAATTSQELSHELATQQNALVEHLNEIDLLPDVGRDVMHTNPPMPLHEKLPAQPVEDAALTAGVNQQDYYHGSKVLGLDLSKADPIMGGSRSELGPAHYLTTDINEARDAANATVNTNVPPLSSRAFEEQGTVHQVRPNLTNVLDATKPPPEAVRQAFLDAARNSHLDGQTIDAYTKRIRGTSNLPLARYYNELDMAAAKTGHAFPESEVLGFQREVNARLREMGYDGIAHDTAVISNKLYDASPTRRNIYADDKLSMDLTKSDYVGNLKTYDVEWTLNNHLTRELAGAENVPVQGMKKMLSAWREYLKTPESRLLYHAPISADTPEEMAAKLRTYLNQGFELTKEGFPIADNREGQLGRFISKSPFSREEINELSQRLFDGESIEDILKRHNAVKTAEDFEHSNALLAVLDHNKIGYGVSSTQPVSGLDVVSPTEAAAARFNMLQRTRERFPEDKVIEIQAKEAGATLQSRIVQQTAEHYTQAEQQAQTQAQQLINVEQELKAVSEHERSVEQARLFQEAAQKNETQSKHLNAPDDGWCS